MKFKCVICMTVLVLSISAQDSVYRDLFGSFGSMIDAKKNFMKAIVTAITAPFRLAERQQNWSSGPTEPLSGVVQQGASTVASPADFRSLANGSKGTYATGYSEYTPSLAAPSSAYPADIPLLLALLSAPQSVAPVAQPDKALSELRTLLIKLLADKQNTLATKVPDSEQTTKEVANEPVTIPKSTLAALVSAANDQITAGISSTTEQQQ